MLRSTCFLWEFSVLLKIFRSYNVTAALRIHSWMKEKGILPGFVVPKKTRDILLIHLYENKNKPVSFLPQR